MGEKQEKKLHIAMYPWFAMGHITPLFHLANKLAKKGHKVSFLLPPKAQSKLLASHNHRHHRLVTFIAVAVPTVEGLPIGAETTNDIPFSSQPSLMAAMDLTYPTVDSLFSQLQPDIVFFDYARWVPGLARKHGFKPVFFLAAPISFLAYLSPLARGVPHGGPPLFSKEDLMRAPPGFPSAIGLRAHEARPLATATEPAEVGFWERVFGAIEESNAVCSQSCREMETRFGDYFEKFHRKPVLWAGLMVHEPPVESEEELDENMDGWLKGFERGSVVYCALGSECVLGKDKFQELALGLELTGAPFLAVLRPPMGCETVESALPEGFLERTKGRGIILNGWVQQRLILKHPCVGYFVTHCGIGSLLEGIVNDCQLVLLPQRGDQFNAARLMSEELKVGVDVETDENDGFFTKEAICKAITTMMVSNNSDVGQELRANHAKWRDFLLTDQVEESRFLEDLHRLLGD